MAIAATCFVTFGHAFWVSNHSGHSNRSVSWRGDGHGHGVLRNGRRGRRNTREPGNRVPRDALFILAGVSHGGSDASVVGGLIYRLLPDRYFRNALR